MENNDLTRWRGIIDGLDRALVHLLNQRAELSDIIGQWKRAAGLPPVDAAREQEIIVRAQQASLGPLDDAAIELLFVHMLAELKRNAERRREAPPAP